MLKRIRAEKRRLLKAGKLKKSAESRIYRDEDGKWYEKTGNKVNDITDKLPFEIPANWTLARLSDFAYSVGSKSNQVLYREVLKTGMLPVVSQSQNLIDGYSNAVEKQITDLPLVMFGDHTKVVKYIDFPFVIGADGTKFLKTIIIPPKYFYFVLSYYASVIYLRRYARHYSVIKSLFFPIPPLPEQRRIAERVEAMFATIDSVEGGNADAGGE